MALLPEQERPALVRFAFAVVAVAAATFARLPLQGRNVTDLIQVSPQVVGTSVAGQNNRYNNLQIDGGVNNDVFGLAETGSPGGQARARPIPVEAVKEFQVQVHGDPR